MKELPEHYTKEEFAAWNRANKTKEKRTEIILSVIFYGGVGAWLLYSYLTAKDHDKDVMIWFAIGGFALYSIELRLNAINEKLDRLVERLPRN